MADKNKRGEDDVNLEMPSLGLGGVRRRRKKAAAEEPEGAPAPEPQEPGPEPVAPELDPEPPSADDDPITILDEPAPAGQPGAHEESAEDTEVLPTEDQRPLFADEAPGHEETRVDPAVPPPADTDREGDDDVQDDGEPGEKQGFSLPGMPPMRAALITGALVGLLSVGAVYLGLRGCEAIQGTSSCGGPGLFLLIAIMIALIFVGGFLLRAWHVSDPMSTSFLAVGLLAVVALLFLTDVIFSPWMLLVIPIVGVGTFALSHWVTVAFIEPAENDTELHDVE